MTRIWTVSLLLCSLLFSSCVKEEYLDDIKVPNILSSYIYRVDQFSEDAFFAATEEGLYLQFSKNDWKSIPIEDFSPIDPSEWTRSKIVFRNNQVLIDLDNKYLLFSRDSFVEGTPGFFIRSATTLAPDGSVLNVGYADIRQNPNSGEFEYGIYVERIINDSVFRVPTNMFVPASTYGSLDLTFNSESSLVISTNPVFVLKDWDGACLDFEIVNATEGFVTYKSIQYPRLEGNLLVGYDIAPTANSPVSNVLSFDLSSGVVSTLSPRDICSYPQEAVGAIKHLAWGGTQSYMYVQSLVSNANSSTVLSNIHSLKIIEKSCSLIDIYGSEELPNSLSITDVGYYSGAPTILMGTSSRLLVYNIETRETESFLQSLLVLE